MASLPPAFSLSSTQTALALIVPSYLQPEINTIRKIHDKAFRKWEPHINILYPFVDKSLLSSAITTLRAHLSKTPISPFIVKIEDVGTFEHTRSATVFLKPAEESEEKICSVRRQLVAALGRREEEGTHDGIFRPHLTIGQASLVGPTKARLVQKVGKLIGEEWEVEGLVVLRREPTGEMSVVDEISLHGEGADESED
jgi:2'-5' RNA ligase